MQYVEMTIEEAKNRCKKNAKVLVAVQDLEVANVDVIFVPKRRVNGKTRVPIQNWSKPV